MPSKSVVVVASLCLFSLGVAWGQQQPLFPADAQITQDFGTDSINLQNLSIGIFAPVISKPGAIPFNYNLLGINTCQGFNDGSPHVACGFLNAPNASQNCASSFCVSLYPVTNAGKWTMYAATDTSGLPCDDGGTYDKFTNLVLMSPSGETYYFPSTAFTQRELRGTGCNWTYTGTTVTGNIKVTTDIFAHLVSLTLPDGRTSTTSGGLTDVFGNILSSSGGVYTDTLGNNSFSVAAQSGATGEIDTYKDTGGTSHQIKQILTAETLKTNFSCSTWPDQTLTGKYAVTEVQYPDGNNLYLQYEAVTGGVTGRLSQLTLRTGGVITYSYPFGMSCPQMTPNSVVRHTADGDTTYTWGGPFLSGGHWGTTTTVIDPGGNKAVYTFMGTDSNGHSLLGVPLTLTQVQVWTNQGTVASPSYATNERRTVLYCYNRNTVNCSTAQASYSITAKMSTKRWMARAPVHERHISMTVVAMSPR